MRRKIFIGIIGSVLCFGSLPVGSDEVAKPPAPNIGPSGPSCPPNMLGKWTSLGSEDKKILGDITITPNAIEFEHFGRYQLIPAGPLLEGIDWSATSGREVRSEDLTNFYSHDLFRFDHPLSVPASHVFDYEFVLMTYGAKYNNGKCNLDIIVSKSKGDAALMLGRQQVFSNYTIWTFLPARPQS